MGVAVKSLEDEPPAAVPPKVLKRQKDMQIMVEMRAERGRKRKKEVNESKRNKKKKKEGKRREENLKCNALLSQKCSCFNLSQHLPLARKDLVKLLEGGRASR